MASDGLSSRRSVLYYLAWANILCGCNGQVSVDRFTIRYNTIRYKIILTCAQKLTGSQRSLYVYRRIRAKRSEKNN